MFIVGNSDTLQSCSRVLLLEFSTIVMGEVAVREILQETWRSYHPCSSVPKSSLKKTILNLPNLGHFPRLIGKKAKTGAVEHPLAPSRMTAR